MNCPKCKLCGEPMPEGEEMFKYHGYSGPCPKPPLRRNDDINQDELCKERSAHNETRRKLDEAHASNASLREKLERALIALENLMPIFVGKFLTSKEHECVKKAREIVDTL